MIKQIAFTGYPVVDMKRARQFYESALGLKNPTEIAGGKWLEYVIGEGCFALTSIAQERFKPCANGPGIAFEVDDVDAVFKQVLAQGGKILLEPSETPICRMAMVTDTEGNFFAIHRRKNS